MYCSMKKVGFTARVGEITVTTNVKSKINNRGHTKKIKLSIMLITTLPVTAQETAMPAIIKAEHINMDTQNLAKDSIAISDTLK